VSAATPAGAAVSQKELEDIAANHKRVAGFQVEKLNARPPIVQAPKAKAS
jgi:hypothetical protein